MKEVAGMLGIKNYRDIFKGMDSIYESNCR